MKRLLLITALAMPSFANAKEWTIDEGTGEMGFDFFAGTSGYDKYGNRGQFVLNAFDADIVFDPANLGEASVEVTIDVTQSSGIQEDTVQVEARYFNENFFNADNFPTASFNTSSIEAIDGNVYLAKGVLVIKDISAEVEFEFELDIDGDAASFFAEFELNHKELFGFGDGEPEFDNEEKLGFVTKITVEFEASAL